MTNIELLEDLFNDIEYITRLDFVDPQLRGEARDHLNEIYHKQNKNLEKIKKELKAFEILKKAFDIKVEEIYTIGYQLLIWEKNRYECVTEDITEEEYNTLMGVLKD